MIQMVGSSNNEYIYINFSELEYDVQWEFPRENLKFGELSMVLFLKLIMK